MEYFGPILRMPRITKTDNIVRHSGSSVATPFHYGISGRSSTVPRSRSSFGCTISDIGREGGVVTRTISPSRIGFKSYSGLSQPHYSTSPVRHTVYTGRGRSFSIDPISSPWTVSRYDTLERAPSPMRRISHQPRISSMSHMTRRDSFSRPYYTINSVGPTGNELVLKRTSVSHPQTFLKTTPFGVSMSDYLSPDGKVLAESNIVSRRTSGVHTDIDEMPDTFKRVSHYRSGTPRVGDLQNKRQSRHEMSTKHSSINQSIPSPGIGRTPSIAHGARTSSLVLPALQRSSFSSLPPLRKISVVQKPRTDNGPMSLVRVVELEGIQTQKNPSFEFQVETTKYPQRTELLKDLKKRTVDAKDRLGRHRVMLDRYLPVKLGPEPDVAFEIQNKYGELVDRLPFIERRHQLPDDDGENETKPMRFQIQPYTPSPVRYKGWLSSVHVPSSFTPVISETRRRARNVLCKVKGDPGYFSFH